MFVIPADAQGHRVGRLGDLPHSEPDRRWAVVYQATGMVSVQLGTDLGEVFPRLRAHAYLSGLRLAEVATDVCAQTEIHPGYQP